MRSRTYSVSPDRLRDVLELLLAAILEASLQLAFDFAGAWAMEGLGWGVSSSVQIDRGVRRNRLPVPEANLSSALGRKGKGGIRCGTNDRCTHHLAGNATGSGMIHGGRRGASKYRSAARHHATSRL
jgi:hypothetical protein